MTQDDVMTPPTDPDRAPTPKDEDEAQAADAAAEFSAALEAFEHTQPEPAAKKPERKAAAPRVGQRVRGRIVAVNDDVMLIDVGGRSEAVADAREFREESGALTVNVGDSIELHVAVAGEPLTLARTAKRQGGKVSLAALRQAKDAGLTVRGKVSAVNTGGLTVDVDGVRAFCPVSQIDDHFVEDTAPYVGRVFEFLVTEVDESRSFAPVKNAPGEARDTPESVRAQMIAAHSEWLRAAGCELAPGVAVEFSPLFAQNAEEAAARVRPGMVVTRPQYFC